MLEPRKAHLATRGPFGDIGASIADATGAAARASPLFFRRPFRTESECSIGDEPLELAILFFERAQSFGVVHLQATAFALPAIRVVSVTTSRRRNSLRFRTGFPFASALPNCSSMSRLLH